MSQQFRLFGFVALYILFNYQLVPLNQQLPVFVLPIRLEEQLLQPTQLFEFMGCVDLGFQKYWGLLIECFVEGGALLETLTRLHVAQGGQGV
jgi:hypothetical protein